jgi:hypothetical protein
MIESKDMADFYTNNASVYYNGDSARFTDNPQWTQVVNNKHCVEDISQFIAKRKQLDFSSANVFDQALNEWPSCLSIRPNQKGLTITATYSSNIHFD